MMEKAQLFVTVASLTLVGTIALAFACFILDRCRKWLSNRWPELFYYALARFAWRRSRRGGREQIERMYEATQKAVLGVEQRAIDHGHAHYDPQTGAFTWNNPQECGEGGE